MIIIFGQDKYKYIDRESHHLFFIFIQNSWILLIWTLLK